MVRRRWPTGSRGPERLAGPAARLSAAAALAALAASAQARAEVEVAPGPSGGLGALLIAGPVAAVRPGKRPTLRADFELPEGLTEAGSGAAAGAALRGNGLKASWQVGAAPSGTFDLRTLLDTKGSEATALAFGVLRVKAPFRGYLLLSVDDGVTAHIDGKQVFARDDERAAGSDDDVIALNLTPGDHPMLLRLHQRGGAWTVRVRLTDEALGPARGVSVALPGEVDAGKLAEGLLEVSLDRGMGPAGLEPRLRLGGRGGYPRGVARGVTALARSGAGAELFSVQAGDMALEDAGPFHGAVVRLPALGADELGPEGEVRFEVHAGPAQRSFSASARGALRAVLGRAAAARKVAEGKPEFLRDPEATAATLEALAERVERFVDRGDTDVAAQLDEAASLGAFLDALDKKEDPFLSQRGARRVAYRSPLDGKPSTFALYVPPKLEPGRRYPLVVALHGMNGKPMNMLRWVFGRDDPGHDGEWEDRHPGAFPEVDAIVVAPMAHFNSMYRYVGEEDVVAVMEWAKKMLPVDPDRVSITGPSMGGTGTAWVAFRYADRFSSAAPLCGYHSYFLRADMAGKNLRPWERRLAEERSTTHWALNGLHLPLMIVHGTRDLPMENSGVLIDRYKSLGYSLIEEHPDEGHNVWQPTYEDLKGLRWLTSNRRPAHPNRIAFRTDSLRYDRDAWLRVARLDQSLAWGEATGSLSKKGAQGRAELKTSGIAALEITADPKLVDPAAPLLAKLDGDTLEFAPGEPVQAERREGRWTKGISPPPEGLHKRARLAGPLRDVHHEPLIVVYGTSDPLLTRANEEVARWFASIRGGFEVDYPIVADVAFDASMARGKALVLVGGPQSNSVTRSLDERLPIHVTSSPPAVRVGDRRYTGDELGAAFVYPNPEQPDRYVVVLAGADVPGTLRAMSLPDMAPDFVVYDRGLAPARGQLVLGRASTLAAGLFDERWRLPAP